jgi:hypothetical protein
MANAFYLTNAVVAGMLNSTGLSSAIGTGSKIRIFAGTVPSNADATPSSPTTLATLTVPSGPFTSYTDITTGSRATFVAITSDTSAAATGTAAYFRIYDSSLTTVKAQGTVGTTGCDLNLNTTAITAGSTVAISAATIDLPEGP